MSIIWGHMPIRYLGLARLKTEGETLAISLSSIQAELLPGLQSVVGRSKSEWRIDSYVEFNTDVLVIMARRGDDRKMLKLARSVIEDNRHLPMLRDFVEELMCGSKGSVPVTQAQTAEQMRYQQLIANQQPADWNGYGSDLAALVRRAIGENQYKGELGPIPEKAAPQITAKELTKEELQEKVARKLDLEEAKAVDPVELLSLGRWRAVMDEVFKDDNKGGEDGGKEEEDGAVSNGGSHGRKDGG